MKSMTTMTTMITDALVERTAGGDWIVRAPRVGIYRGAPRAGARRSAGEEVGRLSVLNHTSELLLPAGVEGIVTEIRVAERVAPVEYGQPLLHLASGGMAMPAAAELAPVLEGSHTVICPIDGVFYHSPSPGAPPFVKAGDVIEPGRTLGLIEAMKSFNAITYGGPGLPESAVILEARAADASEVRQGAILFVVKASP
jgi:acetyl-CoA carboxylase biotin carboxyl carrier protein